MTGYTPPTAGSANWDGPLNDIIEEIDADMQVRALDANVIHTTGAEGIAGLKTFANGIAVPDASLTISDVAGLQTALDELVGDTTVDSVNGQDGEVILTAADVGALPDDATFDDLADGATNVAFTTSLRTKLSGIAAEATKNQSDATLKARANHSGTQAASTISDFAEAAQDAVAAALVGGVGISVSYNDGANAITITNTGEGGGGGGALYARDTAVKTTSSLVPNANETGTITLGPKYDILRVEVDRPARVRLYATTAQRDADVARTISTAPTGNHGVILDIVIPAAGHYDITPCVAGATMDGGNVPITITNRDSGTETVQVTLTFQRTED